MNLDKYWMEQVLELAKKGLGGASPNPLVGCLIVKNKKIVGEGSHARFGCPHAEINALQQAGARAQGATLYVNLEPCCHFGKTPPCTDSIIKSGIKKVVYAMYDPNPIVSGKGLRALKKAGIELRGGVCEEEAKDLNRSFIKYIVNKKPYVILKTALSLDGKICTRSGDSKWISSKASRKLVHQLRSQVDGILVGAETVRRDNPSLTSHGEGRNPVRIVISSSGNLPKKSKIFDDSAPTWVFNGKIKFSNLLKQCAKKGVSKLLIEGGGTTAALALESKEVDEIYFFIAPILIGGKDALTPFEGKGFEKISQALHLENICVERIDQDILINGRIKK